MVTKKTFLLSLGLVFLFSVVSCGNSKGHETNSSINGHKCVNLGLPSGTKWATCNIGANAPEEYGDYYAWGEIEGKSDYSWDTYKWCMGSHLNMTKYCTNSWYGMVDNKSVLESEDDVAHIKWGGTWRTPTIEELRELEDKCTWEWITQNGVYGYRVIGPNGNSIFLPAAGSRYTSSREDDTGSYGCYWSSSLCRSSESCEAYRLRFNSDFRNCNFEGYDLRRFGYTVRPVSN